MKKSIKKAAAIALTAAMAVSMTACGGGSDAPAKTEAQDEAASPAPEGGEAGSGKEADAAGGEKIKLTLCIGRKTDLSFQQSAYEGTVRIQEEMGDRFEINVVEMGDDTTKWQAAFYDAADSGADIIVGTGFQN